MVNTLKIIFIVLLVNFLCSVNYSFASTLLDWNEQGADGTNWPGWTWMPNGASDYGHLGWRKDNGRFFSGDSNWQPRIHEKTDYGNDNLAIIDTTERAPSTSAGASLKVYDTGSSNQSCYWFLFGSNFGQLGFADSSTDRLSFYFKPQGMTSNPQTENSNISNANIHIGTYLCWGGDCPKESDGEHYYHYLTVNDDAWLHVLLDRHPQHRRGGSQGEVENNPASPRNYYENMNIFYLEIRYPQAGRTSYWLDEMELYTTSQAENDISISSVWVGYWPQTDKWEIGFNDGSFRSYDGNSGSTFEIRYSTSPITNENYSLATPINPEYHYAGEPGFIRRPNSWKLPAWTRFEIPNEVESGNAKIYFAIKDVSLVTNGDGHNAPSSNIHTIDYVIPGTGSTTKPSPPTGLRDITSY